LPVADLKVGKRTVLNYLLGRMRPLAQLRHEQLGSTC
jgi:hypothetical protein